MPVILDKWFDDDTGVCNISPLHVINTLKQMGAPKSKINSVRSRADTCESISSVLNIKCLKSWRFASYLGSGNNGIIFSIEHKKNGAVRAAKIVTVDPKSEVKIQKKAHKKGIAPKVFHSCKLSKDLWVVIMEKIDGSLGDLVGGHRSLSKVMLTKIYKEIVRNIIRMEKSNITHGDLSLENMGYVIQPDGDIKIIVIDFGWSSTYVPMFDMISLTQALLFTRNKVNRDFLYTRFISFINEKYDFKLPATIVGVDSLFKDFQKKFIRDFRRSI
jgi:tRNA A-37 threonylcarbamoyl transferase component Bud32